MRKGIIRMADRALLSKTVTIIEVEKGSKLDAGVGWGKQKGTLALDRKRSRRSTAINSVSCCNENSHATCRAFALRPFAGYHRSQQNPLFIDQPG
jgi:hypothetical protein